MSNPQTLYDTAAPGKAERAAASPDSTAARGFALIWGVMLTLCVTGYTFGQSNHHVYLLDGLRFGHPELLARDWFTTNTLQYHFLFTLLTVGLQKIGMLQAGFFTLYLGLVVAMHVAWFSITASLGGNARVYMLSVLIYHLSGGGLGLGVYQILQDGSFLPSNIAAVATLAAMAFWLRQQLISTAICVGIGGLFHVNYAMALIPAWIGLSLLAAVQARSVRGLYTPRALLATAIAMPPCFYNVGIAAVAAMQQHATIPIAEFFAVYVHLRHSHHHEPLAWPIGLWISFLWPLPFAMFALWKLPSSRIRTGVAVVFATILALQAFAFVFCGIWYISQTLVELSLFRFSPFAKLLSCVLTSWLFLIGWPPANRLVTLACAFASIGLITAIAFRGHFPSSVPLPSIGLFAGAGILSFWLAAATRTIRFDQNRIARATLLAALPLCLAFAATQKLGVAMPGEGDDEMAEMCAWAQTQTPADSLFLVPPHDQSFTLAARRAEVVSFKHVPQLSAELVEWKRRLDDVLDMDVTKLPTPMQRTMDAMAAQYTTLSADHLLRVAHEYGCDYVIAMRPLPDRTLLHASPAGRYFAYAAK